MSRNQPWSFASSRLVLRWLRGRIGSLGGSTSNRTLSVSLSSLLSRAELCLNTWVDSFLLHVVWTDIERRLVDLPIVLRRLFSLLLVLLLQKLYRGIISLLVNAIRLGTEIDQFFADNFDSIALSMIRGIRPSFLRIRLQFLLGHLCLFSGVEPA